MTNDNYTDREVALARGMLAMVHVASVELGAVEPSTWKVHEVDWGDGRSAFEIRGWVESRKVSPLVCIIRPDDAAHTREDAEALIAAAQVGMATAGEVLEAKPERYPLRGKRVDWEGMPGAGLSIGDGPLRCRYVGSRYGDAANTAGNRMDDYVVVDWRSRVALSPALCLTLNVDNVLDASYEDFPGVEQPGVFVMAGAELSF